MDEFVIEAVSLKQIKRIRIGHDGTSAGDGWFLDKVIIKTVSGISFFSPPLQFAMWAPMQHFLSVCDKTSD